MRSLISVAVLTCFVDAAFATPQISDSVVFGGREYFIHEFPMFGFWDYGTDIAGSGDQELPEFEVRSSANWKGYQAQFELRDSKLFLKRIVGWIDGKKRKNEEIIPGKKFPLVADWYTGKIHIAVGDFDDKTGESTAVIIFSIEQGIVTKMEFAERMKPVLTWNGLPTKQDK